MIINNTKHINLIQDELIYQTNEFEKLLKKQAAKMFVDYELYLCRYQGYDEVRGNIIVKFDHDICLPPRKNENLQCFVSSYQDDKVKNWGGLTYEALRSKVSAQFESKTVFFNYEKNQTIVGLSGVKAEDIVKYERNALVFLAPTDPPLQYLTNLFDFLKQKKTNSNAILELNIENKNWNPIPLVVDENIVSKIESDLIKNEIVIIQGPPGTGKTYLMAQLCNAFLNSNKKVLVTALTNRALIELAEKEHLKTALSDGKVYKSALTAEESKNKKIKGILPFKSLSKQNPQILLTSYYVMSQIAIKAIEDNHFDYIIIEEASQALLSTIALAMKLGKKCIVIGDIKQLEPIFHKEYSEKDVNNYHFMICGLKALSYYFPNSKKYILTDSYRLTENSVRSTNVFYGGLLKSKSNLELPFNFSKYSILNQHLNIFGGTSLIKFKLSVGRLPSLECLNFIVSLLNEIKQFNNGAEIAVLAFNKDSIRSLQKEIFSKCTNTENIIVETIDRIQGLTTDYCIFFVPNESIPFALQANRFNVATSRARNCSLLVMDEHIESFLPHIDKSVQDYILSIKNQNLSIISNHITSEENEINSNLNKEHGIKVLGKIDLSKFEKPKKELSHSKENIYIIDTNVFVDCPDILSKINPKYCIVVSAKVIDELDYLKVKLTESEKQNVNTALKLINKGFDKPNLKMDVADFSLLPDDFNKKSPDNFILSVALKYKIENPILLTSDNGLQIKAKGLNITTITLKEFLKQIN